MPIVVNGCRLDAHEDSDNMNDSSVPYFLVSYLFCLKNQIVPQVIAVLGGIQIEIRL